MLAYRLEDGKLTRFETPALLPWGGKTLPAWRSRAGTLWINTIQGLHRWRDGEWVTAIEAPADASLGISALTEDDRGDGFAAVDFPPRLRGL